MCMLPLNDFSKATMLVIVHTKAVNRNLLNPTVLPSDPEHLP